MKRLAGLAALILTLAACGVAGTTVLPQTNPDANQVSYWCPSGGIKLEPVSTPFVVPAPPDGYVWTLLVLKAGSGEGENQQFPNPVVGQSYSRSDGKSISHAILCKQIIPDSTTSTTTSTTSTTTTSTTTTSTTLPPQGSLFAIGVGTVCTSLGNPVITITFGERPDLDGQTGPLSFSTGGSVPLTFQSGASVTVPYPGSAGTGPVNLEYTLGEETETASVTFPTGCTTTTSSTTLPPESSTPTTAPPSTSTPPTNTFGTPTTTPTTTAPPVRTTPTTTAPRPTGPLPETE